MGNSNAGKSTFAAALADVIAAEHVELDAIFHQPAWTQLPREEFRQRVADRLEVDRWVADGNYSWAIDEVWLRADSIVWLDLSKRRVRTRAIRRTLSRLVHRTELWNGNRERVRNLFSLNPDNSIILWAWTRHDHYVTRYEAAMRDSRWSDKEWHRLRSPEEVSAFLELARIQQNRIWRVEPMSEEAAGVIAAWRYDPPLDVYINSALTPMDLADDGSHFVVLIDDNDLVDPVTAYASFGRDGHVVGYEYDDSAVDFGFGLRPDLVGHGVGERAIGRALWNEWAERGTEVFRATVRCDNTAMLTLLRRVGFIEAAAFVRPRDGVDFTVLTFHVGTP